MSEFWNSGMFEEREAMLAEVKRRMIENDIFYEDIWQRVLITKNSVLREILDGHFELRVKEMRNGR